jgi:WD40 repeat protein
VWRLADGMPVGEPLTGYHSEVAVGTLPDGTPVIVSGDDGYGGSDATVRVWRLADGMAVGKPLTGHVGEVAAVAVGALPDGTPIIVSGGSDATVRVWRLANGIPLVPPLHVAESVSDVTIHGDVIVTATGANIAVHRVLL